MNKLRLAEDWQLKLRAEFSKPYFAQLTAFVKQAYTTERVYPRGSEIFRALDSLPFEQVKVVILGQDPYHGPGQANGLSFSVPAGIALPPSLKNILAEVRRDTGQCRVDGGDLGSWVRQGVLLLNATLTVAEGRAGSHQGRGWELFTDAVIAALNAHRQSLVYMLWGSYAQRKGALVDTSANLVLKAAHPSPLSAHRGFKGCGHFSKANAYLTQQGKEEIQW